MNEVLTWVLGAVVLAAVFGKVLLKTFLMGSAKKTMVGLLKEADIIIGRDITVNDDKMWFDWLKDGELAIGESYMANQWETKDVELDIVLTKLMSMPSDKKRAMFKSWNARFVALSARIFNYQSVERSGKVGAFHYDIGNDFYALWLDSHLQYSCAYWKGAKNLEEAQQNKLKLICDKLKLEPGHRVLEIGCGWGGLACYMAKNYKVHVTGITISHEQLKGAAERAKKMGVSDLTSFEYQDYRSADCNGTKQYDRVVSIAMLEAVGYKNIDEYFMVIRKCMKTGGLAVVHSIAASRSTKTAHQRWILKYIFPNGFLPTIKQIAQFCEKKMIVEDVHNLGPDYDDTLMAWNEGFQKHYAAGNVQNMSADATGELKLAHKEMFKKMWEFYLMYCAAGFRARTIQLYQVVLSKHRGGRYDAPR
jgi:cyclopropane-fatty-acyl-phospholipid synthase